MSRASTLCCPTCGGPVADGADPAELLDGFAGGGRMRAILEAYVLAYPRKISRSNLIDRIYADDADGVRFQSMDFVLLLVFVAIENLISHYGRPPSGRRESDVVFATTRTLGFWHYQMTMARGNFNH